MAAVVSASGALASSAFAALPIFGGATSSTTAGDSYGIASPVSVNDLGIAVGSVQRYSTSFNDLGMRGLRWGYQTPTTELGTLTNTTGLTYAQGVSISRGGVAVGYAYKAMPSGFFDRTAVRWQFGFPAGPLALAAVDAATYGSTESDVTLTNETGMMAGSISQYVASTHTTMGSQAVRWTGNGATVTVLGNFGTNSLGYARGGAIGMNDNGMVVGFSEKFTTAHDSLGMRPVRWDPTGTTPVELDVLGLYNTGRTTGQANAVNATGTVVGAVDYWYSDSYNAGRRAVRWEAGSTAATMLDTLGTGDSQSGNASATAINAHGVSIGVGLKYDGLHVAKGTRGIRWNAGSTAAIELQPLTLGENGYSYTNATAINDLGIAVGTSQGDLLPGATSSDHAVLWSENGSVTDLNALLPANSGWNLTSAGDISRTGFIAGAGEYDPDGPSGPKSSYNRNYVLMVPQAGTYGQGDADLDADVDFADLLVLAKHYGQASNSSLAAADFDLNGTTDFTDLLTLAKHYGTPTAAVEAATGDAAFAADWAMAQSLVPEPSCCAIVCGLAGFLFRRRPGN